MKIFDNFLLNPFWVANLCTFHVLPAIIGAAGSIGASLLGRQDAPSIPATATPTELAQRGIGLRKEIFPEMLDIRRRFDPQFLRADIRQTEIADQARRQMVEGDLIPSTARQRQALNLSDIRGFNELLRNRGEEFSSGLLRMSPALRMAQDSLRSDEGLLNQLRGQAGADLRLGGQLSPEDIRAVEQQTASAVGQRGRGAGAFSVGQLALNRQSARDAREMQRRQFASGVLGLGGQFDQRALSQSDRFTKPFLQQLSETQQANRQIIGSPAQQFQQSLLFAQQGTPEVPFIDPQLLQLESLRTGQGLGAAELRQKAAAQNQEALAGGLGGAFSILGKGLSSSED